MSGKLSVSHVSDVPSIQTLSGLENDLVTCITMVSVGCDVFFFLSNIWTCLYLMPIPSEIINDLYTQMDH